MAWLDKILNRTPEKRNYTDMVTAYHWDRVHGREYQALCAVEACVSLISNCFALASFKPSVPGLPNSEQLTEAVRAMLLRGESLWYISVKKGEARLVQSSAWDISGDGYDPRTIQFS